MDELVSGAWTAAWPLIRTDLELTYVQVGLLLSFPLVVAHLLEPLIGLLGDCWDRRALVRAGGVGYVGALLLIALSDAYLPLLIAVTIWAPAGGAFVSLSQASLMDADPRQHELNMARWTLAGSLGMVAGPLALSGTIAAGPGWRTTFVVFALVSAASLALVWRAPIPRREPSDRPTRRAFGESARNALRALRRPEVLRWLTLLEFSDLMLDVLHGYLALYFVDVVGLSGARAAFAILVWTGVGLAGDALLIPLLRRVEGLRYLRASALAVLIAFPAFLLVAGVVPKLLLVGLLGLLTTGWYPILGARLYSAMPGQSATVMAVNSAFGLVSALLPLAIGAFAQRFGLGPAMWLLVAGPIALLIGLPRRVSGSSGVGVDP